MQGRGRALQSPGRVAADLLERFAHRPLILGIAGESGSGKTTLAAALAALERGRGGSVRVLHVDDWYHLPPVENQARRIAEPSWCGPCEVDLCGLEAAVRACDEPLVVVEGTWALALESLQVRVFVEGAHAQTLAGRVARGRDVIDEHTPAILDRERALLSPFRAVADYAVSLSPEDRSG